MKICVLGINHQQAPVAIREKVAITPGRLSQALKKLNGHVDHGIILSTCNRTEIYTMDTGTGREINAVMEFLVSLLETSSINLQSYVYFKDNHRAVEHLFRLVSGLESMIIGEYEILGQVSRAVEAAQEQQMVNLALRNTFHHALRTGRRVREETDISKNALSVSSLAVDLAENILGRLDTKKMLVIGSGEAGVLVAKVARSRGIGSLIVVGRNPERATILAAELDGTPASPQDMERELCTCDIVVTCAGAPHRVLGVGQVKNALKKRNEQPLLIIDIAVPRNVEPAVAKLPNIRLYNIDDIMLLSEANRAQREQEVKKALIIIEDEMKKFQKWWQEYRVRPLIRAIMKRAEEIRQQQFQRTVKKCTNLSQEEKDRLEMMTKSIVNKILKDPIMSIKSNGTTDLDYADVIEKLFSLKIEEQPCREE